MLASMNIHSAQVSEMNKYFSSIIVHVGGVCAVQHSEEDNNQQ